MKYFRDASGNVYGFDETDPAQLALMNKLTTTWTDVTGSWPPPITLSQAQTAQIAILYQSYLTAIYQPVTYNGIVYQADQGSQDNLNKMLAVYTPQGATPAGFYWVAADNSQTPFTLANMQSLANVMGSQGWTAFQHLQTKKAAVLAATTIAQVQTITW